jgi:arginase family enzyme
MQQKNATLLRLGVICVPTNSSRDAALLRTKGVGSLAETLELYDEQALQGESLASITQAVLAQAQTRQWWLHVDLDVLSTEALSAIDYPQPGGLIPLLSNLEGLIEADC